MLKAYATLLDSTKKKITKMVAYSCGKKNTSKWHHKKSIETYSKHFL